jgi:hypothetical protein
MSESYDVMVDMDCFDCNGLSLGMKCSHAPDGCDNAKKRVIAYIEREAKVKQWLAEVAAAMKPGAILSALRGGVSNIQPTQEAVEKMLAEAYANYDKKDVDHEG